MLFLAKFILKGQSQAALVAASMAILGMAIPPAAWISAAAVVLVTLVNGPRAGLVTTALSLAGAALFAFLIFSAPFIALAFAFLVWLPAWIAASILRQSVSLALSLQVLTALSLFTVAVIYALFPDFGEFWREPLDIMVTQLASQSADFDLAELKQTEDWVISFLPGLFVSSIMSGTILSLFIGRWWQAVYYNPGGFGTEFKSLNLGKISALICLLVILAAMAIQNVIVFALATVVLVLYGIQALSLVHAVINIRKISASWLFAIYVIMFFVPHLVLLLIFASFVDPWLDIRQRLTIKA